MLRFLFFLFLFLLPSIWAQDITVSPANGAREVPLVLQIEVRSTDTINSFSLKDEKGTTIPGDSKIFGQNTYFHPFFPLSPDTTYQIKIGEKVLSTFTTRTGNKSKPEIRGWQLHSQDESHILDIIRQAHNNDINHLQLSHSIAMNVDDVNENPERIALVNRVTQAAHQNGIQVYLWTHEFNDKDIFLCMNPQNEKGKKLWQRRTQAYRDFFRFCPEVDGVLLMFGSSKVEPWYAMHDCNYCTKTPMVDKLELIVNQISKVVQEECGKKVMLRSFIHRPIELKWMQELVKRPLPVEAIMHKCVPQDWEPYYPNHPLIGNSGPNKVIIEYDLAGEYCGQTQTPYILSHYLHSRILHQKRQGVAGYMARVERGSRAIFDTPNEVNAHALKRLWESDTVSPENITQEWVANKYGTNDAEAISQILTRSFIVARKTHYMLGFWVYNKGPKIPDMVIPDPILFALKDIALWDQDYKKISQSLVQGGEDILWAICREKDEAIELAQLSLNELDSLSQNYPKLRKKLWQQKKCAQILRHISLIWYALPLYQENNQENKTNPQWASLIQNSREELQALAQEMESTLGPNVFPGNPKRIRTFLKSLATVFPESKFSRQSSPFDYVRFSQIKTKDKQRNQVRVSWKCNKEGKSFLEYGREIPDYGRTVNAFSRGEESTATLQNLMPGTCYVFRVALRDEKGKIHYSGDFSFLTTR